MAIWESIVAFLVAELLPWAISLLKKWLEENFIPLVSPEGWGEISALFQKLYDEAGQKELAKAQWAITQIFCKLLPISIQIIPDETVPGAFFKDMAEEAVKEHKAGRIKLPDFSMFPKWTDADDVTPDWRKDVNDDDGGGG